MAAGENVMTYWQYAGIALCIGIPLLLMGIDWLCKRVDRWLARQMRQWRRSQNIGARGHFADSHGHVRVRGNAK